MNLKTTGTQELARVDVNRSRALAASRFVRTHGHFQDGILDWTRSLTPSQMAPSDSRCSPAMS
jgi:hypothetical protein